jgi:hypothetical protein
VSRIALAAALLATALVAWLSQGSVAFTGVGHSRVVLLPLSITSALVAASAAGGVWLAWRAGASLAPLWLLGLVVLPWIPGSTPAAFLIWSGPLAILVWAAIALSLTASAIEATGVEPSRWLARVVGKRTVWSEGALACAI